MKTTLGPDSVMQRSIESKVRPVLDLMNNLRKIGIEKEFSIPQIVVMGDQSSGKSSVLEAISSIPFPRGAGLVTRLATAISMKKTREGAPFTASIKIEYFDAGSAPSNPLNGEGDVPNETEIGARIATLTNALVARGEKGATFSKDRIVVEVSSPYHPDLTIVDLPGIVRTRTEGQSASVVSDVQAMIEYYLKQEHTIVLAVIPANADIATNEIIEKAAVYDPSGSRIVGVVTKPDLVDPGAEDGVVDLVENRVKKLKLGYVLVRNRGQKSLDAKVTIEEARQQEEEYFNDHVVFKALPKSSVGASSLTAKLTEILYGRIVYHLPEMRKKAEESLVECEVRLKEMGEAPPTDKGAIMMKMMYVSNTFCVMIENTITGHYVDEVFATNQDFRLQAYTHKHSLLFQAAVNKSKPAFGSTKYLELLKDSIAAARGQELPGFISRSTFNLLVGEFLNAWKDHADEYCRNVVKQYITVLNELASQVGRNYYAVKQTLLAKSMEVLEELQEYLVTKVENAFREERDIPSTLNHYYMDTINKVLLEEHKKTISKVIGGYATMPSATTLIDAVSSALSSSVGNISNEEQEAKIMETFLQGYWKVSSKRFIDKVPQLVQLHFGKRLQSELKDKILPALLQFNETNSNSLFEVAEHAARERLELEDRVKRLKEAKTLMAAIPTNLM